MVHQQHIRLLEYIIFNAADCPGCPDDAWQQQFLPKVKRVCVCQHVETTTEDKKRAKSEKVKKCIRTAAGTTWEDQSLLEWESGAAPPTSLTVITEQRQLSVIVGFFSWVMFFHQLNAAKVNAFKKRCFSSHGDFSFSCVTSAELSPCCRWLPYFLWWSW